MLEGYALQTVLSLIVACLPLAAFFIMLGRRLFSMESMVCLMSICLLSFFRDFLMAIPEVGQSWGVLVSNVHVLINFILIILVCKTLIYNSVYRRMIPTVILCIVSVFATYMLLTGLNRTHTVPQSILAVIVLVASLIVMYQLMRYQQLNILNHPLFYMAIGLFFFHFQYLLVEIGGRTFFQDTENLAYYSWLLMLITKIVEYLFFIFAAIMAPVQAEGSHNRNFSGPLIS